LIFEERIMRYAVFAALSAAAMLVGVAIAGQGEPVGATDFGGVAWSSLRRVDQLSDFPFFRIWARRSCETELFFMCIAGKMVEIPRRRLALLRTV